MLPGHGHSLVSAQFHLLLVQMQYPDLVTPVASTKPLPETAPHTEQAFAVQLVPAVGGVVGLHRGMVVGSL